MANSGPTRRIGTPKFLIRAKEWVVLMKYSYAVYT